VKFEWDINKNIKNQEKHKISFEKAIELFDTSDCILKAKTIEDEERYAIIGIIDKKCYVCIFTFRNDKIRIISVRRCRKKEEEYYESKRV
jgi:uncharacterized DUF497 family protein